MSTYVEIYDMARRQGVYWLLTIPYEDWSPPSDFHTPEWVDTAYLKGQCEVGASGYRHWQVLVVFKRKQSLNGVKSIFGRSCHAELSRSSAADNYVWKEATRVDGTQFEYGELPIKRNSKTDWERVWQSASEGDILGVPASVRVQHYRTLRTIRADFALPQAIVRRCFVFCGRTGTGKSRRAWDEAGLAAYPKDPRTKFWDGYRGI